MTLSLVTAAKVEPLSAAEAKAILNIGDEVSDAVLQGFITAARLMIDGATGWIGRALNTQTWKLSLDGFPGCYSGWDYPEKGFYPRDQMPASSHKYFRQDRIVIPLPPLQSVDSISYTDTDNAPQTLDPANYIVTKGEPSFITLASGARWPSAAVTAGSVAVQFKAGYGDAGADVPQTLRTAIALQVSHLRSLTQQNLFLSRVSIAGVSDRSYSMGGGAESSLDSAVQALLGGYRVWI